MNQNNPEEPTVSPEAEQWLTGAAPIVASQAKIRREFLQSIDRLMGGAYRVIIEPEPLSGDVSVCIARIQGPTHVYLVKSRGDNAAAALAECVEWMEGRG